VIPEKRQTMTTRTFCALALCGIVAIPVIDQVDARPGRKAAKKSVRKTVSPAPEVKKIGTTVVTIGNGTRVKIPANYRIHDPDIREFFGRDFVVRVFARSFSQGEAAYCEVVPHKGESFGRRFSVEASFGGKEIPLMKRPWGFRGLFAIPPDITPGLSTLEVSSRGGSEDRSYNFPVGIAEVRFAVYRRRLRLGAYSDSDIFRKHPELKERYQRERSRKKELFARLTPDILTGAVSHPRDHHHVTSSFYAKRMYDRYKIAGKKRKNLRPKISYHEGLDLWGPVGSPVYAIAGGIVAMAEEMYYEGNQVIIDHGGGVFSRYMHLSEMLVRPGMKIDGGDAIGRVGASGMVTGPHLHAALLVRGVYVDPESILYLPVRN